LNRYFFASWIAVVLAAESAGQNRFTSAPASNSAARGDEDIATQVDHLLDRRLHRIAHSRADLAAEGAAAEAPFASLVRDLLGGDLGDSVLERISTAVAALPEALRPRAHVAMLVRAGELAATDGRVDDLERCAAVLSEVAAANATPRFTLEAELLAGMTQIQRLDLATARETIEPLTAADDPLIRGRAFLLLGNTLGLAGDDSAALQAFVTASEVLRAADAVEDECTALIFAAQATPMGGDPRIGLEYSTRATELATQYGWAARGFEARQAAALLYVACGDHGSAIDTLAELETVATSANNDSWLATVMRDRAIAEFGRGDLEAARVQLERSLAISERIGDRDGATQCHLRLALLAANLGDTVATEHHANALLEHRPEGDWTPVELHLLLMRADARTELGDREGALADATLALRIGGERGNSENVADALRVRAIVHANLGDHDAAARDARESVRVATDAELAPAVASGRIFVAHLLFGARDLEAADAELQAAEAVVGSLEGTFRWDPAQAAFIAIVRTAVAFERGDLALAESQLDRAEKIAVEHADPEIERHVLLWRCNLARRRAEVAEDSAAANALRAEAAGAATRLLELAEANGEVNQSAAAREALASLAIARGDVEDARAHVRAGLATVESFAGRDVAQGLGVETASRSRASFMDLYSAAQDVVAFDVESARARGADDSEITALIEDGFARSGSFQGRALVEGIVEHRAGARTRESVAVGRALAVANDHRDRHLQRATVALHAGDTDGAKRERGLAEDRSREIEQLDAQLDALEPRSAALFDPPAVSAAQLRAARCVDPATILIAYVRGYEKLFAYVITESSSHLCDLGPLSTIDELAAAFVASVCETKTLGGPREIAAVGRALAARILDPAIVAAGTNPRRLVIVPTGPVASIPFEALVVAGDSARVESFHDIEFVLDRYEVRYSPSTAVLLELAASPPRNSNSAALVFADSGAGSTLPPLTNVIAEAELVAKRFERATQRLESDATANALEEELREYRVLHFASHAIPTAIAGQPAGLLLRDDEGKPRSFTIGEVLGLDLAADLVVLSACSTTQGEVRPGEGVESLARAFLFAGARCVVASLFPLSDAAALPTIDTFYSGWLVHGDAAAALREAKLRLRRADSKLDSSALRGVGSVRGAPRAISSSHPFVWAPLIAIG
jgi:tetratricopeptide (TPR) repeat protein